MANEASLEIVPVVRTPIRLEYTITPGRYYARYLGALAEGRIIGGRCPVSRKVYVPPRASSPTSGLPTDEEVTVSDTGTLTTFCIINIPFEGQRLEPPYVFGCILLDGADLPIYHLISGLPLAEIRMGLRVRARWRPSEEWGPTLENIAYFEPTGEPDAPYETYEEHL